jgi:hypothetical protein
MRQLELRWEFGQREERSEIQMREEPHENERREDEAAAIAQDAPNSPHVVEPLEVSEASEASEAIVPPARQRHAERRRQADLGFRVNPALIAQREKDRANEESQRSQLEMRRKRSNTKIGRHEM